MTVPKKETKEYPVDCDDCEDNPNMELKATWISKTNAKFSLYQCPQCKNVEVYMEG